MDALEAAVAKILTKKKLTIAVAESCTGGLVSHRLTNISGSSRYFVTGIVAYSNESKENILGISRETMRRCGTVSKEIALKMAEGIRYLACVDIGLGITGTAGPTGGTKSRPVGLVYIALVKGKSGKLKAESRKMQARQNSGSALSKVEVLKAVTKELCFKGTRQEIKFQASQAALELVRRNI